MAPGAGNALDIRLSGRLRHDLGDCAKEVAPVVLLHEPGQVHRGLGHRSASADPPDRLGA
jgi:hypothetical protein